jgi:hypothetical protein
MNNSSFGPGGSTFFVDSSAAVHVVQSSGAQTNGYRVRNLTAASAWFQYQPQGAAPGTAPASMAATAPSGGSPSVNTIGMLASSVETFVLPPNAWFIASAGASFEICAGEGL